MIYEQAREKAQNIANERNREVFVFSTQNSPEEFCISASPPNFQLKIFIYEKIVPENVLS